MKESDFIIYLSGKSIKDDCFIGLKEVSVDIMQRHEKLLVYNLRFLLSEYPEKIIDLFNLEIDYINELLKRELNLDLNLTIEAGFKVAQSKVAEDVMNVICIIGYLTDENQLIFKHTLEKKMREKNIYFHISLIQKDSKQGIIFCTKGKDFPDNVDKSIN